MATVTITFNSSKLAKLARGLNKTRFDANPPTTLEEGEEFVKEETIARWKAAFANGDEWAHEDTFVPEPGLEPNK